MSPSVHVDVANDVVHVYVVILVHVPAQDLKPTNFTVKNSTPHHFHLMLIDLGLACHIGDAENKPRHTEQSIIIDKLKKAAREAALQQGKMPRPVRHYERPIPVHVGTRGYRSPHLLQTSHCDYTDDLWVGALIVFEMASAKCVYDMFVATLPVSKQQDKSECNGRVTDAVIQRRYIPWKLLASSHPHLQSFLRRITHDEQPFFESAAEIIQFIVDDQNDHVFQMYAAQTTYTGAPATHAHEQA
jgi:serine/threonine protein kinase